MRTGRTGLKVQVTGADFYTDLGADYFDQLDKDRLARRSVQCLEALGYTVVLTPKQEVA